MKMGSQSRFRAQISRHGHGCSWDGKQYSSDVAQAGQKASAEGEMEILGPMD